MDNLSVHKTKEVREVLEEHGIEVIYTPPYSLTLRDVFSVLM